MTIDELMKDIAVVFPRMKRDTRKVNFGAGPEMRWMISAPSDILFPDGLPIFSDLMNGEPTHDIGVHEAFINWVENRGWYLIRFDDFWWMFEEIPSEEEVEALRVALAEVAASEPWRNPLELPF